MNSLLSVVFVC